jgi:hypothetical protein
VISVGISAGKLDLLHYFCINEAEKIEKSVIPTFDAVADCVPKGISNPERIQPGKTWRDLRWENSVD